MVTTPDPARSTTADPATSRSKEAPEASSEPTRASGSTTPPAGGAPRSRVARVRRVFELIGVGLVAATVGVGVTWLWWTLQADMLEETHQSELTRATTEQQVELTEAKTQLKRQTTDVLLLDARRWLHRAVIALDQHNFGTARENAATASQRLQRAAEQLEGQADQAAVAQAHEALRGISPEVTADVGAQRSKYLSVVEQLDPLLSRRLQGTLEANAGRR